MSIHLVWVLGALLVATGCAGKSLGTVGDLKAGEAEGGQPGASGAPGVACEDGRKSAGESDIDCGGPSCDACPPGGTCERSEDCASRVCLAGECQGASCSDGLKNGDEAGVDCGGSCPTCRPTEGCQRDGVVNGTETDVDCGGLDCLPCEVDSRCGADADCESGLCRSFDNQNFNTCRPAHCKDLLVNGDEVDLDCGGSCDKCPPGRACNAIDDCEGGLCDRGMCIRRCDRAGDCGSASPSTCEDGRCVYCQSADDCPVGQCSGGAVCACSSGYLVCDAP